MLRSSFGLALIASIAIAGYAAPAAAQQTKVGVAAAVNQELMGTPPTAPARNVILGNDVFHKERLVTNAQGQAQMLFLDGSAFTVGPNSDLVLDEFVYDPATGTGKLAATAAKGLVRFVGGKLSKNQPVTIATPTANIGIRGGIALVTVDAETGATEATFLFGVEMTVTSLTGDIERISRQGFASSVQSRTTAPTTATKASSEQLKGSLDRLNGQQGATGGMAQAPTAGQVDAGMAPGTPGMLPPPPPLGGVMQLGPVAGNPPPPPPPNRDAQQQAQRNAVTNAALPAGAIVSYRLDPDPALGSNYPTVRGQTTGNPGSGNASPFFGVSSGSTGTVKSVQVSVAIDGQSTGQRSVVVVTTGEGGDGAGMQASTRGTARASATPETAGIVSSSVLNGTGATTSFAAGHMPDGFVMNGNGADTQLVGGSASYGYRQTGTRLTSTPIIGARETTVLNGFATGFAEFARADGRPEPTTPLIAGTNGTNSGPGNITISTDAATGRLAATFGMTSLTSPSGQWPDSVTFNFGANPTRGTYVDRSRFAAVESDAGTVINEGGVSRTADSSRLYLVSNGLAQTALPGGMQPCECEFVQWGWWGGVVVAPAKDGVSTTAHGHMGNWVAGPLVPQSAMPTTGSASYSGHAVGTVVNDSARYIAAGTFSASFNFGSRSGNMTIGSFDGMTMTGAITTQNGRDYSSTLAVGGRAGLEGRAQGTFFTGAGDPVRETGGQFTVGSATGTGTKYRASGIFVGRKQ
jgi:hypothetical protein